MSGAQCWSTGLVVLPGVGVVVNGEISAKMSLVFVMFSLFPW